MRRRLSVILAVGVIALAAGCTSAPGAVRAVRAHVVSVSCDWGAVIEWDGTPGPATPTAALRAMRDWYEVKAAELESTGEAAHHSYSPQEDAVVAAFVVRGLLAMEVAAEKIGLVAPSGSYEIVAVTDSGEEFARATVSAQPSGGFRVDTLGVHAFVGDDPSC